MCLFKRPSFVQTCPSTNQPLHLQIYRSIYCNNTRHADAVSDPGGTCSGYIAVSTRHSGRLKAAHVLCAGRDIDLQAR